MLRSAYRGIMKDSRVVSVEPVDLPEEAEVLVTPLEDARGSPQAILAAVLAPPHLAPADVDALEEAFREGQVPIRSNPPGGAPCPPARATAANC